MDIDIGEQEKDRITVYIGDDAAELSENFCLKHGFDHETQKTLEDQLNFKINKVLEK